MNELEAELQRIARVPVLLVASDYDGTIAPIVSDPDRASPDREAIVALRMLAGLPQTHVALISGRALRDLARLSGLPEDLHLVGSHGGEFDLDFSSSLAPSVLALRERVEQELAEIAATHRGASVESKPASIALHYRNVADEHEQSVLSSVLAGPAQIEGVHTKRGKKVIELGVVATDKGRALETVRHRVGASAVVFLGDDATDEDAFATLAGPDVAVKVGSGESRARHRVDGTREVARVLARLAELRAEWLAGSEATAIEQHALLSDLRTLALVTPDARLTWLCLPRLDSPALFAELLGGPTAGRFAIRSADGAAPLEQRYSGRSLILHTRWPGFEVIDFLDCSAGRPWQRAGRSDLIRSINGRGRVALEFAPRIDFGRVPTRLRIVPGGLEIEDMLDPVVLRSPGVEWRLVEEGPHHAALAEVDVEAGPLVLELRYGTGNLRDGAASTADRFALTEQFWSAWANQLILPSREPELVARSALLLKGLCYGPTGAISAAGTTSLPEHVGGVRNWDYRYCWIRDAAMAAASLARLGSLTEAMQFLGWLLGVTDNCESPDRLQPLYGITGSVLGSEGEISELAGYRGSRPVRIGNLAAQQVQLDVFGPVVELVALLVELDAPLSSEHWRLVEAMVTAVERRWQEPDHGIWEIRRPRRHHVHSKVMCWLTLDRAIRISEGFLQRERPHWKELRDQIAIDVLGRGFKPDVNAFTAAYDSNDLDAAALWVGLSGLLDPRDRRFVSTVEAIERQLRRGPTVYRYRADDGLPGFEGGFHLCASWLVEAYLQLGRRDEAEGLFEQLIQLVGPTGLLSEQYDPRTHTALGNVPQAYSHIALIENALRLS